MAYTAEISRANPSCFLFLIDQSGSMQDVVDPANIQPMAHPLVVDGRTYTHTAQGRTKAQGVCEAISRLLYDIVLRCSKETGIYDYFEIGVVGYGGAGVGPAFGGVLASRDLVTISEIGNNPIRIEQRKRKDDDGAGGIFERTVKFPVWFDPTASGGTPMCEALARARSILSGWLPQHPNCFPPVVIHISDGESTDGEPLEAMRSLTSLSSSDGNVLLFNLHISGNPNAKPISFPDSPVGLPDQYARTMFEGASVLTSLMRTIAQQHGFSLSDGAKGFVLNADMVLVVQALDIGTRAANMADR